MARVRARVRVPSQPVGLSVSLKLRLCSGTKGTKLGSQRTPMEPRFVRTIRPMRRNLFVSIVGLLLISGSASARAEEAYGSPAASAQGSSSAGLGLGLGVEATLTGLSGAALVYDAGAFRIDGVLGIATQGNTDFFLAGRFWYVLHTGDNSDFAIGGGLGIEDDDGGGPMGDENDIDLHVEAGAQIRAFITANVALSASGGFGFIVDEGDDFLGFGGQLMGTMGVTYFFE